MSDDFQVRGTSEEALFHLCVHRGDGMALLAMNWKKGRPPRDFVGFAIEYQEPGGDQFFPLQNRLNFLRADGSVDPEAKSTLVSPIQKFRWVHFPRNAELPGAFHYRVTPVFMAAAGTLRHGVAQAVAIELRRETYPGACNVTFTRGFVSSQAFVDKYASAGSLATLLPANADDGPTFQPTHPKAAEARRWMGFEARSAILELLDQAIDDAQAQVRVVAYDLNEPEILTRLAALGPRLRIVIDDDGSHGDQGSAENAAAAQLAVAAGAANVRRQHMGHLQHNKTIVVDGPNVQAVVCGSTNFSWRGLYVQANHAVIWRGATVVRIFTDAFEGYWRHSPAHPFPATPATGWQPLGVPGIAAQVTFSPHAANGGVLQQVAADVAKCKSSLLYSLAFLYQTPGVMRDTIQALIANPDRFVYGISDRKVGGIEVQKPDGNLAPVYAAELSGNVPEPFRSEPVGGSGTRMHHKFVVVDFDKPTARVWFGSFNFSKGADVDNGENLLLVADRRIAVSFMVEALRIVDHYHFRVLQKESAQTPQKLALRRAPKTAAEAPWWLEDYTDARKKRDRILFAK